jgi:hypothetical protein
MKKIYSASAILLIAFVFAIIIGNSCKSNSNNPPSLSPKFPDYQINYSGDIQSIQSQFDEDMWETFVALCWPADYLNPIAKGNILDQKDARPVFENYSFNYDLFLLNLNENTKLKPAGWGKSDLLNLQRRARWERWARVAQDSTYCPNLIDEAAKHGITNMAEIIPLDEFIQASNDVKPHVPQIDLDSNFVWSSVIFNKDTYHFVIENLFYSEEGLELAKKSSTLDSVYQLKNKKDKDGNYVIVPKQEMVSFKRDTASGALHLKTSWKILNLEKDDTSKFHTAWGATVFNNLNYENKSEWKPQCSLVKVGLVGMHISVKTKDQPDFIWATFEHVDNCPEVGKVEDKDYTFYDPTSRAPINKAPSAIDVIKGFEDPLWYNPKSKPYNPSQIVREVAIPDETKALNRTYQEALGNSVWSNYQLVGTQWKDPNSHKVFPRLLSNTTLESFDQLGSSCFACHHQVTPNTLKGGPNDDQFLMAPVGNVLNLPLNVFKPMTKVDPISKDTFPVGIYSDYMWSLLKWTENGHLTWKQVKK